MTELLLGNNKDLLEEMEDGSIDALVTDPPYLINFMGKDWDKENSPAGDKDFWALVLKKMKPGAHGLVFGHSRQHHRVMTALEDAGFEIRDCLMWLYGSGFPKSHNIGKAVDKLQGNKREEVEHTGLAGGAYQNGGGKKNKEDASSYATGTNAMTTKGNSEWEGWGTALKPAYEPIIMVRKPIEKKLTIAKNVLKHGVGGINIDASRVGASGGGVTCNNRDSEGNCLGHPSHWSGNMVHPPEKPGSQGRFPANVMLSHHPDCKKVGEVKDKVAKNVSFNDTKRSDSGWGMKKCNTEKVELATPIYDCVDDCPVKILDEQSGKVGGGNGKPIHAGDFGKNGVYGKAKGATTQSYKDKGGASRFFYNAKVSKKERNAAGKNTHPTVKPIALMKYLIKLITPQGGKVLDPFMGSGSTGMACVELGNSFIGMEREVEYYEIATDRIEHTKENKDAS